MSKPRPKRKERQERRKSASKVPTFELLDISPLTKNQELAFDSENHLVLSGSAGCGKSFMACYFALDELADKNYKRMVIIRSAVPSRDMGFLPGNDKEKASAYADPYRDIFHELTGRGDAFNLLEQAGGVQFKTTSYLRGTTFRNSYVIVDEVQNMNFQELNTVMTRIGEDCRVIFCGDFKQADLKRNGMDKFMRILDKMESSFDVINFTTDDIVRSGLVKDYLIALETLED